MLEVCSRQRRLWPAPRTDDAALTVDRGEIVVILGANGAGKTTLDQGHRRHRRRPARQAVTLAGRDLSRLPAHEIVEAGLALVPEGRGIFGELTVARKPAARRLSETGARQRGRAPQAGAVAVSRAQRTAAARWCAP